MLTTYESNMMLQSPNHTYTSKVIIKVCSSTADSTTVADFVATYTGFQRILWSKNVLMEMGFNPNTFLHQDNTSSGPTLFIS